MIQRVLFYFLDDFVIRVWYGNFLFDFGRFELTLVLELVHALCAALRIDGSDLLAFLQEYAVDQHSGLDRDRIVVDQKAFIDCAAIFVAINDVSEVSGCVLRRCRSQAELDRVEMIKRVAPERLLGGSISAMAFVGDDQIKCMDRNRQRLGQILFVVVAAIEASIWKEIPGHALWMVQT